MAFKLSSSEYNECRLHAVCQVHVDFKRENLFSVCVHKTPQFNDPTFLYKAE